MLFNKVKDPTALRNIENLRARAERAEANLEYIAMMADIEIPTEEDQEVENNNE